MSAGGASDTANLRRGAGSLRRTRGIRGVLEATLRRPPRACYARPDQLSERGVEGAVLVVELLSPGYETYDKLDWSDAVGVDEVLVVDPETRTPEVFVRLDFVPDPTGFNR